LDRGDDPKTVVLLSGVGNNGRQGFGQTVQYCSSCTNHVFLLAIPAADNQQFKLTLLVVAVIANYYGSDASASGIIHRYERDLKPNVKLLKEAFDNGKDPKDVVLVEAVRDGKPGKRQALTLLFCLKHMHGFLLSIEHS